MELNKAIADYDVEDAKEAENMKRLLEANRAKLRSTSKTVRDEAKKQSEEIAAYQRGAFIQNREQFMQNVSNAAEQERQNAERNVEQDIEVLEEAYRDRVNFIVAEAKENMRQIDNMTQSWLDSAMKRRDRQLDEIAANRQLLGAVLAGAAQGMQQASAQYQARTQSRTSWRANRPTTTLRSWTEPDQQVAGCSNDFACGVGSKCVKQVGSFNGYCAREVNRFGLDTFRLPDPKSVGEYKPFGYADCNFDTECGVGFYCEQTAKTCLKR